MSLADKYEEYPKADEPQYVPRVQFDGNEGFADFCVKGNVPNDFSPLVREMLTAAGHDPDKVTLGPTMSESHWQQRAAVREWSDKHSAYIRTGEYESVWLHSFKVKVIRGSQESAADLDALIAGVKAAPRVIEPSGVNPYWFVFQAGDLQIGKRTGMGSTSEIIECYQRSIMGAVEEFKALKRFGIEGIQISMPGDCLEGNQSQGGRNMWLTQQTITEQTRIFRRLLFETIEAFAPLANQTLVTVVNGNHDEGQRFQSTYPGDGWATESAIITKERIQGHQSLGHVEILVPDKWKGHMTVPVGDSTVVVLHAHQCKKRSNIFNWWAQQALNHRNPGAAKVMQHGHFHTFEIETNEHKTRVGSPTFDGGSPWFEELTGASSKQGAAVYLLRANEVSRVSVI